MNVGPARDGNFNELILSHLITSVMKTNMQKTKINKSRRNSEGQLVGRLYIASGVNKSVIVRV